MKIKVWLLPMLIIMMLLLFLAGFSHPQEAVSSQALPTRPSAPPTAVPMQGGIISLILTEHTHPETLWTKVQWQNEHNEWVDVEGWRGEPNSSGYVEWFVGPELLNDQTPFRWLVYDDQNGKWLATSEPFALPSSRGVRIKVYLTLSGN